MLITIAILIYLIFGLFDAVKFKTETPNANILWCTMAMLFTPAVRMTAIIVANWMLAIIVGLVIYLIYR
jgi:hypothetical protein